jgi:hypothetical protein
VYIPLVLARGFGKRGAPFTTRSRKTWIRREPAGLSRIRPLSAPGSLTP